MVSLITIHNPYIFGSPIGRDQKDKLFGRDEIFEKINVALNEDKKLVLLQVKRRIGKSSVINFIPDFVDSSFYCVSFSCQSNENKNNIDILYSLAERISDNLEDQITIKLPKKNEFRTQQSQGTFEQFFSENVLNQIISQLKQCLHKDKLLICLDEFDTLWSSQSNQLHKVVEDFRRLVSKNSNVYLIVIIGQRPDRIASLKKFFDNFLEQQKEIIEVGLLDKESTISLIKQAEVPGGLQYTDDAIKTIYYYTCGHPSLTQSICLNLFTTAIGQNNPLIDAQQVNDDNLIKDVLAQSDGFLESYWEGLDGYEIILFIAVAILQEIDNFKQGVMLQQIIEYLKKCQLLYNPVIQASLEKARDELVYWGYLDYDEETEIYQVKVKLVRLWLITKHQESLKEEIKKINREILQTFIENLQNKVDGVIAVFLLDLDHDGEILSFSPKNTSQSQELIAKRCYDSIKHFKENNIDITEMELLTREQRIYVQQLENSIGKFILCLVGKKRTFQVGGYAKNQINKILQEMV